MLKKDALLVAFSQLAKGTFIAQVITLLTSPITTRIYSVEELGIYTLLLTLVSILSPILSWKYDMSIVASKNDNEAEKLLIINFITLLISVIVISLLYKIYLNFYPQIYNSLGLFSFIILPILFLTGVVNILTAYNNRKSEYKLLANISILRSMWQNSTLVLFGFLQMGSLGLLLSQLVGISVGVKKQSLILSKINSIYKNTTLKDIKNLFVKYKKMPIYSLPSSLINSSSYSLLNLFISSLYGISTLGYYSLSYKMLGLPITIISSNFSKVFFQTASEENKNSGNYSKTFTKMTLILLLISFPITIILMFTSPLLFELLFGEGWSIAGEYVVIMAPMFGIRLVVSALATSLIISNRQGLDLILQLVFMASSLIGFAIGNILNYDIYFFLTFISISYSAVYVIYYIIMFRLSRKVSVK